MAQAVGGEDTPRSPDMRHFDVVDGFAKLLAVLAASLPVVGALTRYVAFASSGFADALCLSLRSSALDLLAEGLAAMVVPVAALAVVVPLLRRIWVPLPGPSETKVGLDVAPRWSGVRRNVPSEHNDVELRRRAGFEVWEGK